MLLVMCIWKKEFIMQVEKRGSLSVLEAEPSSLFPWNVWKVWMVVSSSGWPLLTWWALLCVHMSEHSCLWIFFYAPSHPPRLVSSGSLQSAAILCFVYGWILNLCGPRPLPHCVWSWRSMNTLQCHLLQATDTNSRFKKKKEKRS